jgi:hypothetical protein
MRMNEKICFTTEKEEIKVNTRDQIVQLFISSSAKENFEEAAGFTPRKRNHLFRFFN